MSLSTKLKLNIETQNTMGLPGMLTPYLLMKSKIFSQVGSNIVSRLRGGIEVGQQLQEI